MKKSKKHVEILEILDNMAVMCYNVYAFFKNVNAIFIKAIVTIEFQIKIYGRNIYEL